jgi:hypothetical protein
MSPCIGLKDCGIARRCKLFSGTEFERGAMVLEDPLVWPPLEHRREFAAANLKAESYLEREHNARWAALGVAHATRGTTANVLTLLLPRSILARDQLNPYPQGTQGKEVEQWQTGTVHLNRSINCPKAGFRPSGTEGSTCPVVAQRITT